ncbi:phage minor head protein [Enterococcus sp. 2201sp1_2201st1_B8_2201SCRN_220225]|uniref:polymorphic toxin type 50 domain-containing protein n=1 Tax=unclassified Enterococcus TaxID=2608891 RepID=UPI0034A2B93A
MVKKNKYQLEIEKILDRSEKDLAKDLQSLYKSLASEITKDIAQLQKEIDTDDKHWKKLQKERLESIRASMYQQINQVEKQEKQSLWSFLKHQGDTAFNALFYEFEMSQKIPLSFAMLADKQLETIINTPVASRKLSTRLKGNATKMKKNMNRVLVRGFAKGLSTEKMALQISEVGGASYRRSMNIARTEAGRVTGVTTQKSQQDAISAGARIKKKWVSTLDGSTRHTHQQLDGQVREVDEYFEIAGKKTLQPHMFGRAEEDCNCRCIAISVIKGYEPKLRRDNELKEVIEYKNYEEWRKAASADPARGNKVTATKQSATNKVEFKMISDFVNPKVVPKTFDEFLDIKYNDVEGYRRLSDQIFVGRHIREGKWHTKINAEKQNDHLESTAKEGKSYFLSDINVQALLIEYAGTGKLERTAKGKRRNVEFITTDRVIGYDVSLLDGSIIPVTNFYIHYSSGKTVRTHLVPTRKK